MQSMLPCSEEATKIYEQLLAHPSEALSLQTDSSSDFDVHRKGGRGRKFNMRIVFVVEGALT